MYVENAGKKTLRKSRNLARIENKLYKSMQLTSSPKTTKKVSRYTLGEQRFKSSFEFPGNTLCLSQWLHYNMYVGELGKASLCEVTTAIVSHSPVLS